MHKPLPSTETLISRNAKEAFTGNFLGILKSRMKRINSSYKLIEFLYDRGSGADTIVNVATVELRFRTVVFIKKFLLNVAYEKIGVARSHFGTHGHAIDLFIITGCE